MNIKENDQQQSSWINRVIKNPWLTSLLEIIAFILLVFKVIPTSWLHTDWPFLVLISLALIGLLINNYRLTSKIIEEVKNKEIEIKKATEKLNRKAKYADIIPMLNIAFQELHNTLRRDYSDKLKYHEPFMIFCQNLEKVFSHLTGVDCHVCIKLTVFPNDQIPSVSKIQKNIENLQVKTYCRSSSGSSFRKQIDQAGVSHLIKENTDFENVFKSNAECFFNNDLAQIDEYKNSSFKQTSINSCIYFPKGTPFAEKSERWPLKYRATIVTPIRPTIKEEKEEYHFRSFMR